MLDHVQGTLTGNSAIIADSNLAIDTLNVGNSLTAGGEVRFNEGTNNGTNYIGIKSPNAVTASQTFVLPDGDGTAGQFLKTDGSGNLAFASYPQVFHSRATGDQAVTNSYTDISGCVLTGITPRSANSKFLITGHIYVNLNNMTGIGARIIRTASGGDTTVYTQRNIYAIYQSAFPSGVRGDHEQNALIFLDSPSTTNTIGYKLQVIEYNTETLVLNQGDFSSITVQEYLG